MAAFLKIDYCRDCGRNIPWEWVPPIILSGKSHPGTGVWHSLLLDGRCPNCIAALELKRQNQLRSLALRTALIQLLGGEKPYREFTFERYEVTSDNRLAFDQAKHFNPANDSLYLW